MRASLIKGGIPLLLSLLLLVGVDQAPNASPPSRLVDIVTANLYADLLIIGVAFYSGLVPPSSTLCQWYTGYALSAVIADTGIGVIYLLVAHEVADAAFSTPIRLVWFGLLAIGVQWVGDLLFYLLFRVVVPEGSNSMLDHFRSYGEEAGLGALLGDSFLVVVATLLGALFRMWEERYVGYALILAVYVVPFLVHARRGVAFPCDVFPDEEKTSERGEEVVPSGRRRPEERRPPSPRRGPSSSLGGV